MKKENRKFKIKPGIREDYPDYYHMPLELHYKGYKCMLKAGRSDDIAVYRDGNNFIILATNYRLGYAGIDYIVFDHDGLTMHGDIFIQNTEELNLKKNLLEYSDGFIVNYLMQWIN